MVNRRILFVFLGLFLVLLFVERPGTRLFDPDESRYAEIPREMMASGDYLTPHLNGSHYFEKPPLLYWLNAGSMKLFGENPYAARLPTRLAAAGTALLILGFLSTTTGAWAALVYLAAPLPFALGRLNLTDAPLTFFMTLAFLCLWKLTNEREKKRRQLWAALLGGGMGFAMLSKGLIAVVLPGAVILLWVAIMDRWKLIRDILFSRAVPAFLAISFPWFFWMEKANPGFLNFFFIHEHIKRFATNEANRYQPGYFFLGIFIVGFLPWLGVFFRALKAFFTRWTKGARIDADGLFFVLWFFVILIFFSLSHSKLIPYILPAFPAAAILTGRWMAYEEKRKNKFVLAMAAFWGVVYLVIVAILPSAAKDYTDVPLAEAAAASGANQVYCYRTYSQSFPWVLKKLVPVVEFQGELASDGLKSPALFPTSDEFWKEWYSDAKVVAVLRKGEEEEFNATNSRELRVLARNKSSLVVANFAEAAPVSASRK